MIRWVFVIFLVVIIISRWLPWLEKLGLGRLPGDLRFRFGKQNYSFPFASTIVLSVFAMLIARLIK
ncbi:DUF2905 domain-containing protein [Undibacterium sp. SXout20W]|uniref:DUF2905 domain-containing protein n=1 Tax=Undibacterium sp. SXout20W TaxID=3413051 RepID=UPI003BF21211